jgi:hypothetical protein
MPVLRADSAFYASEVIGACRALGAGFSITARMNASVKKAVATIDEDAWTAIKYPQAIWDDKGQCQVSDAEIAEAPYTAFTSERKKQQVTARLIVRRVKRLNPDGHVQSQGELFTLHRYHCAFTDSPPGLIDAEKDHRRHAIAEQVIADAKSGPLAHLPSGDFQANAARLALAAITHNLTRAMGTLASAFHAKATTGTVRAQLITVPARITHGAHRLTPHLPQNWPWRDAWQHLFATLHAPPRN